MAVYRILTLDGGGIRGLLSAVLMDELDRRHPGWISQVDMIAGTSSGGILALALANGMQPAQLVELYYALGPIIFKDNLFDDVRDLGRLIGADYSTKHLRGELRKIFADTRLQDLDKRVLITAFDLDNEAASPEERSWKPKFFHNFPGADSDGEQRLADVALYTSAAPTYFPSVDGYIDGGVVANHPGMVALSQTQDERSEIPDRPRVAEIRLLSIGAGRVLSYIKGPTHNWGLVQWAKPLLNLMLDAVSGVPDFQCRQMLGANYHRLNYTFADGKGIGLGEWKKRDRLVEIGRQEMLTELDAAADWLAEHWLDESTKHQE